MYDKGQDIRSFDIWFLGPWLIWLSRQDELTRTQRAALQLAGFGTIVLNWHNWTRARYRMQTAPAAPMLGANRWAPHSRVQSLLFDRDHFDDAWEAKAWARGHGFEAPPVDTTANYYRLRQETPRHFQKSKMRTKTLDQGVKAIIGAPKTKYLSGDLLRYAPVHYSQHADGLPHVRSTIATMARLAREGAHTYPIRHLATEITKDIPSKQYLQEMQAVYRWVRDNIRYRKDPVGIEWVQSPERTLKEGAGDCDDIATLIASLLETLGHNVEYRTVGPTPQMQSHVGLLALDTQSNRWISIDPVVEPPASSTAPRAELGRFGAIVRGAAHRWDRDGQMLSGKTTMSRLWDDNPDYFFKTGVPPVQDRRYESRGAAGPRIIRAGELGQGPFTAMVLPAAAAFPAAALRTIPAMLPFTMVGQFDPITAAMLPTAAAAVPFTMIGQELQERLQQIPGYEQLTQLPGTEYVEQGIQAFDTAKTVFNTVADAWRFLTGGRAPGEGRMAPWQRDVLYYLLTPAQRDAARQPQAGLPEGRQTKYVWEPQVTPQEAVQLFLQAGRLVPQQLAEYLPKTAPPPAAPPAALPAAAPPIAAAPPPTPPPTPPVMRAAAAVAPVTVAGRPAAIAAAPRAAWKRPSARIGQKYPPEARAIYDRASRVFRIYLPGLGQAPTLRPSVTFSLAGLGQEPEGELINVGNVQNLVRKLGGVDDAGRPISVDGIWGPSSREALQDVCRRNGLLHEPRQPGDYYSSTSRGYPAGKVMVRPKGLFEKLNQIAMGVDRVTVLPTTFITPVAPTPAPPTAPTVTRFFRAVARVPVPMAPPAVTPPPTEAPVPTPEELVITRFEPAMPTAAVVPVAVPGVPAAPPPAVAPPVVAPPAVAPPAAPPAVAPTAIAPWLVSPLRVRPEVARVVAPTVRALAPPPEVPAPPGIPAARPCAPGMSPEGLIETQFPQYPSTFNAPAGAIYREASGALKAAGYVEVGQETQNPGLAPVGYNPPGTPALPPPPVPAGPYQKPTTDTGTTLFWLAVIWFGTRRQRRS